LLVAPQGACADGAEAVLFGDVLYLDYSGHVEVEVKVRKRRALRVERRELSVES